TSGSPAWTRSPTSRYERLTIPEILLLTEISRRGRVEPMARAFSTTGPRVTGTVFHGFSFWEFDLLEGPGDAAPQHHDPHPPESLPPGRGHPFSSRPQRETPAEARPGR